MENNTCAPASAGAENLNIFIKQMYGQMQSRLHKGKSRADRLSDPGAGETSATFCEKPCSMRERAGSRGRKGVDFMDKTV